MISDHEAMQLAIQLAKKGLYTTSPNPRVGCVLVRDGAIIGQGYHRWAGEGHAEVNAIADAGGPGATTGATAYVTLEPCSYTGRTAPCCEALIAAGVKRVVVAMTDPNPLVSGRGNAALAAAGILVEAGLLEQEARSLNPGFIKRMEQGLPWVRLKMATSLDGRTAMASGESQWITGPEARADVQGLRARSCAIVTGIETVLADDAALTVRSAEMAVDPQVARDAAKNQPLRVVVDSKLRLPLTAKVLQQPGSIWVVTASQDKAATDALEKAGASIKVLASPSGNVDLEALFKLLAEQGCNEVMVETGPTLAGAIVQGGWVDEMNIYMAPTLMGSSAKPLLDWPMATMAEQQRLLIDRIEPIGNDWRIDARMAAGNTEAS